MTKANLFLKYDSILCIWVWKVWNWRFVWISLLYWSKNGWEDTSFFVLHNRGLFQYFRSTYVSPDMLIYFFKGERGFVGGRGQPGETGPKGAKVRGPFCGKTKLREDSKRSHSFLLNFLGCIYCLSCQNIKSLLSYKDHFHDNFSFFCPVIVWPNSHQ